MGAGTNHPAYERWLPRWQMMRCVADGEQAVKACGERFLPCPAAFRCTTAAGAAKGQGGGAGERYEAYKARAEFADAVAPARDFIVARLFADAPSVALPKAMLDRRFGVDTAWLNDLAKRTASELVETGRFGIAVDMAQTGEGGVPVLRGFPAESIVNWRYRENGTGSGFSLVVLEHRVREDPDDLFGHATKPRRLVMALDRDGLYYTRLWDRVSEGGPGGGSGGGTEGEWVPVAGSHTEPQNRNGRLNYIPFHLFSVTGQTAFGASATPQFAVSGSAAPGSAIAEPPMPESPMLEPLANAVLRAYETSAWLRNGLYLVGTPTAYIADDFDTSPRGFTCRDCAHVTEAEVYRGACGLCGSGACSESADPDPVLGSDSIYYLTAKGRLAFAEVSGTGFEQLGKELVRLQEKIVALGARMLRLPGASKQTATAENIAERIGLSTIRALGSTIDRGFDRLLNTAADFMNIPPALREGIAFRTDRDFTTTEMAPADIQKLIEAWRTGGLPLSIVLDQLKAADVIGSEWTEDRFRTELG